MNSTAVLVRIPPAMLERLDRAIAMEPRGLTRPGLIRRLLAEALSGRADAASPPDDVRELRRKFLLLAKRVEEMAAHQG
jgi:hypothetical protein